MAQNVWTCWNTRSSSAGLLSFTLNFANESSSLSEQTDSFKRAVMKVLTCDVSHCVISSLGMVHSYLCTSECVRRSVVGAR